MPWPTPQDYVEAVQNPHYAFDDVDLKSGNPEQTPLGLPKVISGQFACVFKLASAHKSWAVRCFARDFQDHQVRYNEISRALQKEKLPFSLGFEFLPKGIRIRGQWYPIIKMEWLSGQLLGNYIADNVTNATSLVDVGNQIAQIHLALKSKQIAHGDLQHGNIIVSQGKLFLIDYDGMYVPNLAGRGSHEIGHRNYQHPFRTESDFNAKIDTFSVWIIYLSLIALSFDSDLWKKLNGGDDSILFKSIDYKEPFKSSSLNLLKGHSDSRVREIAYLVEDLCYKSIDTLQPFEWRAPVEATPVAVATTASSAQGASWINDWKRPNAAPTQSNWIVDHLTDAQTTFLTPRSKWLAALIMLTWLSFLAYLLPLVWTSDGILFALLAQSVAAGISVTILYRKYSEDEAFANRTKLVLHKANLQTEAASNRKDFAQQMARVEAAEQEKDKPSAATKREQVRIDSTLQGQLRKLSEDLNAAQQRLQSETIGIHTKESNEKAAIQATYNGQINPLKSAVAAASTQMDVELGRGLQRIQEQHVDTYLSRYTIAGASISGIGEKLTQRLSKAGIRSAADAAFNRVSSVEGIGDRKASAIVAWRNGIIQRAKSSAPSRLEDTQEWRIRTKYKTLISTKEAQIQSAQVQMGAEIQSVTQKYSGQRTAIETRKASLHASYESQVNDAKSLAERESNALRVRQNQIIRGANDKILMALAERKKLDERDRALEYQLSICEKKLLSYRGISFANWVKYQIFGYAP